MRTRLTTFVRTSDEQKAYDYMITLLDCLSQVFQSRDAACTAWKNDPTRGTAQSKQIAEAQAKYVFEEFLIAGEAAGCVLRGARGFDGPMTHTGEQA